MYPTVLGQHISVAIGLWMGMKLSTMDAALEVQRTAEPRVTLEHWVFSLPHLLNVAILEPRHVAMLLKIYVE